MEQDPFTPESPRGAWDFSSQSFARFLRILGQIIGIALIVAGAYYAMFVLSTAIKIARQPDNLAAAITPMVTVLKLDNAVLTTAKGEIPVGRTIAAILLLLWYMMTAAVALNLIGFGGRLVMGEFTERKAFAAAMKQFLMAIRTEAYRQPPKQ